MPLISGGFLSIMVKPLRERGLPIERWIEGLPIQAEQVIEPEISIEWDSFQALMERAAAHLGGLEELERFFFEMEAAAPRRLLSVLGIVLTPERLYRTLVRYARDEVSPPLRTELQVPAPGKFIFEFSLDDDVYVHASTWYVIRAILRRLPLQLRMGQPDIKSTIGEREARFEIEFARRSLLDRARRRVQAHMAMGRLIREYQDQQRTLRRGFNALQRQTEALRASEAQNLALVEQLESQVAERTREIERRNEELREVQARLIRAERLGAAQELAGSVAHAINNPLTALIGQIQMMIESASDAAPELERLHQVARRIRDVVVRTLQLFRQGELDLSSEDPTHILEDVCASLAPLATESGVEIETKVEAGIAKMDLDGALLRAALGSLVENAIEATPAGGTVWLELGAVPSMHMIEFRVMDAGRGIPIALREHVLEPFFTTKSGGTGLGLAIANGVITGHRGRLAMLERPGGGTLVTVELPLKADPDGVSARAS